jgi:hypothetical protein
MPPPNVWQPHVGQKRQFGVWFTIASAAMFVLGTAVSMNGVPSQLTSRSVRAKSGVTQRYASIKFNQCGGSSNLPLRANSVGLSTALHYEEQGVEFLGWCARFGLVVGSDVLVEYYQKAGVLLREQDKVSLASVDEARRVPQKITCVFGRVL